MKKIGINNIKKCIGKTVELKHKNGFKSVGLLKLNWNGFVLIPDKGDDFL